jgi:hypothetical protein
LLDPPAHQSGKLDTFVPLRFAQVFSFGRLSSRSGHSTRTMQSYKSIIAENTTLVLSTGSDLFKFLKGMAPDGDAK